jgi:tight adherence protein B
MSSGGSITESILSVAEDCPVLLRPHFQAFKDDLDGGIELGKSLQRLKVRLGHVHADRLIELLSLVEEVGGIGLIDSLRGQVKLVRQEVAFKGEISSKLGWITGTAKFAVGAPWLLVAMLSTRPENAAAYASAEGSSILLLGLAVSIFAFRLVQVFGVLPASPRVFV